MFCAARREFKTWGAANAAAGFDYSKIRGARWGALYQGVDGYEGGTNSNDRFGGQRALTMSATDITLRSIAGLKIEDVKKHFDLVEGFEIPESPADVLRENMEAAVAALLRKTERQTVVLAIDNLDRCRPDAALRFIESLLVFGEIPRLRTVVAADHGALTGFIDAQFAGAGFNGALYLEKIFPHTVAVPDAEGKKRGVEFIANLLKHLDNSAFKDHEGDIATFLGEASAPRRAKRILRRLERLRCAASGNELLILLTGIVLAETWPALYSWLWVCSDRNWTELNIWLQAKPAVRPCQPS